MTGWGGVFIAIFSFVGVAAYFRVSDEANRTRTALQMQYKEIEKLKARIRKLEGVFVEPD